MNDNSILKKEYKGSLTEILVDDFSTYTAEALKHTKLSTQDILRFRLSVESVMCVWLEKFRGHSCSFTVRKRFGISSICIALEGPECDPREKNIEDFGTLADSSLLQMLGLTISYSYKKGINQIIIMPPDGMVNRITHIFISLVLGIGLGFALRCIQPALADTVYNSLVSPIFDALMNLLRTIASPLIFLAVLSGIYDIGDISVLGKIGKKLISRFIILTFVFSGATVAVMLLFVPVTISSYSMQTQYLESLMDLILQIIPTDIFSPFIDGNMLQVIFLAVTIGIGMLILGEKVSELNKIIGQIYSVVQLLMETIGKMIPIFIFLSSFSFVLSGSVTGMKQFLLPALVVVGIFLLMSIIYALQICTKFGIRLSSLFRKMLPTFLVALSTASSAAAFSVNVDTCESDFGISPSITRFGIPLGQVVFMPLSAVETLSISMAFAHSYDVEITPLWIITAVLVCSILAIATPPIPGGAMSIFTILFLQLGIPDTALALAISIDLLLDYIITAGDLICLQEELILSADKLGLLDRAKLCNGNRGAGEKLCNGSRETGEKLCNGNRRPDLK